MNREQLHARLEAGHTVEVVLPCGALIVATAGEAHVATTDGLRLVRTSTHPDPRVDGHAVGEMAWYVSQLVAGRPLPVPGTRMSQPMQDRAWLVQCRAEAAANRATMRLCDVGQASRSERGHSAADRTLNSRPRARRAAEVSL